ESTRLTPAISPRVNLLSESIGVPDQLRRYRNQGDDTTFRSLSFVAFQTGHDHSGVPRIGAMDRATVVAQGFLGESFRVARGACALRPSVTIGVQGNALDVQQPAAAAK